MSGEQVIWEPYRKPLRATLMRTGVIALVIGAVLARLWAGPAGLARWPAGALLALWPALGGHVVELWFLNVARPRRVHGTDLQLPAFRAEQRSHLGQRDRATISTICSTYQAFRDSQ